jgi:hypothetical protein
MMVLFVKKSQGDGPEVVTLPPVHATDRGNTEYYVIVLLIGP